MESGEKKINKTVHKNRYREQNGGHEGLSRGGNREIQVKRYKLPKF